MKFGLNMLEEVGETGIKILLFLNTRSAKLTDFREELGVGNEAVYRCVLILERYQLIMEHNEGKKRIFDLTPKGKLVAEKMWEAEKIMTSEHLPQERHNAKERLPIHHSK